MNDSAALNMPVVRVGVSGLPNLTDCMTVGGTYVLVAETPSARFPLLASSLSNALDEGFPCTVIVPANPEQFIQRVDSFVAFDAVELIASNRLQLFVMQDEFSKAMFRFGAEALALEMEEFGIPEDSYLVFDQADELLSLHDISLALEQISVLGKWFAQRRITAFLVFSRVTEANSGTINAIMDNLSGIARLGGDKEGLELTFDYWQSPEGAIAARHFLLLTDESGLYQATTKTNIVDAVPDVELAVRSDAPDAGSARVFYMDPDLGTLARLATGTWHYADTLIGMMHASRNLPTATCILSFQHDTNLRQLAEAVHTLRLTLGRKAQLVVQEKAASLRYQNEALLLRLGVNLVIHRDVPASRLPLLLESIKGQTFNRNVDINFEAALASVVPTMLRGYLLPSHFVREVETIFQRSATLDIPCVLIVGRPLPELSMEDVLSRLGLSRPGDLVTVSEDNCYLFLNACPQTVMLTTVERILKTSIDQVFEDVKFIVQREEISSELAAVSRAFAAGSTPDFSEAALTWAAAAAPAPTELPSQSPLHVTASTAISPTVHAAPPPKPMGAEAMALPKAATRADINTPPALPPAYSEEASFESDVLLEQAALSALVPKSATSHTPASQNVFGKHSVPRATRSAIAVQAKARSDAAPQGNSFLGVNMGP